MTITGIVFFVLKWFEFLILFFTGKQLEKTKSYKNYWKIAWIPIVVFALVEGLRWGRLIDWNNGVVEFEDLDSFVNLRNISNPLYTTILYSLKLLGLSYPFFVVLQCGFLMFSALFFMQDYKKYLRWILPCLLMAFVNNENFIRFYFAVSFFLIALYYYLHHSHKQCILFSILSLLTHFVMTPFVLLLPLLKFLNNRKAPRALSILLFLVALFLVDISQLEILVRVSDYVVSLFGMEEEYTLLSRLNSMNDIINGTAQGTEGHLFTKSLVNRISQTLLYVPLIWMAPSALKKEPNGILIYNLAVLNIIISPILSQAELVQRIPLVFNVFVVIAFAAVIYSNIRKGSIAILIYMMLFIYFYAFLNVPFVRDDYMMYFLWDSNGAATNFAPYL